MSNLCVVALPKEDDYVNKLSSDPAPHMTILFLGDTDTAQNVPAILDFLEHATETMLMPFDMYVDYRGTLGTDEADVLFFKTTGWDMKHSQITQFRDALLQDTDILMAYNSIEQFPEWQPHLTLGYPAAPAKADNRDYPGTSWVSFDRIALWTSENDGPEFRLTHDPDSLEMSGVDALVADILNHSGVKGMKWGVRKESAVSAVKTSVTKLHNSHVEKSGVRKDARWQRRQLGVSIGKQRKGQWVPKVDNTVRQKANKIAKAGIKAINNKPEYKAAKKQGILKDRNHETTKRYRKEHIQNWTNAVHKAVETLPHSPSGNIKLVAHVSKKGSWWIGTADVQHDNSILIEVMPIMDDDGAIIDLKLINSTLTQGEAFSEETMTWAELFVTDILSHSGVKGMKWGVRKDNSSGGYVSKNPKLRTLPGDLAKIMLTPHPHSLIAKGAKKTSAILTSPKSKSFGKWLITPNERSLVVKGVRKTTKGVRKVSSHHEAKSIAKASEAAKKALPQTIVTKQVGKKITATGGANHPAHPDAIMAKEAHQKLQKSGVNALSNKELQIFADRAGLEKRVSDISSGKKTNKDGKTQGQQLTQRIIRDHGPTVVNHLFKKALAVA